MGTQTRGTPDRISATTSPSIRTSASPAARAAATDCCSTSRDVANPKRIDQAADINMSFWHSATFSNDGTKILFSDEWGGGSQPRCRDTDKLGVGRQRALHDREPQDALQELLQDAGAADVARELRRAQRLADSDPRPRGDGAGLVSGRHLGVRLDRRRATRRRSRSSTAVRVDATRLISGGSWSVYWYNGLIVSSEIARGLDIFELLPSGLISQNEIDAAKTVQFDYLNAQEQRKFVWPPSFAKARAYLDQLERGNGLATPRVTAVRTELAAAEKLSGQPRQRALSRLAAELKKDQTSATDQARTRLLSEAITELAAAR